jgi:hypothetical protein
VGPGGGPIQYFPVQTASGPHNHAATAVHNYAVAILMKAEYDLRQQLQLSPKSEALLAMLNVGRIVNDAGSAMGLPAGMEGAQQEPPLGRVIRIASATPAIFAPALTYMTPVPELERPLLWREEFFAPDDRARMTQEFVDRVLDEMAYRPELKLAERIPVRDPVGTPSNHGASSQLAGVASAVIKVTRYAVTADRVTLALTSASAGYLQLSHPWYPTLEVFHNGRRIEPLRGTFNLIVAPVEAGQNTYLIVPSRSSMRVAFGWFSAGVLGLTLLVPLVSARYRRAGPAWTSKA